MNQMQAWCSHTSSRGTHWRTQCTDWFLCWALNVNVYVSISDLGHRNNMQKEKAFYCKWWEAARQKSKSLEHTVGGTSGRALKAVGSESCGEQEAPLTLSCWEAIYGRSRNPGESRILTWFSMSSCIDWSLLGTTFFNLVWLLKHSSLTQVLYGKVMTFSLGSHL